MARASSVSSDIGKESTTAERRLAGVAAREHGVLAHQELLDLGFGERAIQYRLSIGRLHRLHVGVYAVGHAKVSWLGQLTAAVKACGPSAVISHRTAADLWGIRKTSSPRIEVTSTRRIRRPGIVVHQPRRMDEHERTVERGIPVTAPGRTLDDLGRVLRPD